MNTARTYSKTRAGYTMIEIALAVAVIGFALVAIIGILPSGLQVQKDNREETIINQDGVFWLEAIRSGATGTVELASFVNYVREPNGAMHSNCVSPAIIGILSQKRNPAIDAPRVESRAISGPLVMRDNQEMNFKYSIHSSVYQIDTNLFSIRLSFYWPIRADGKEGNNIKVFRTEVAGTLHQFDLANDFWQILPYQF
jgi:hypothetical protein